MVKKILPRPELCYIRKIAVFFFIIQTITHQKKTSGIYKATISVNYGDLIAQPGYPGRVQIF